MTICVGDNGLDLLTSTNHSFESFDNPEEPALRAARGKKFFDTLWTPEGADGVRAALKKYHPDDCAYPRSLLFPNMLIQGQTFGFRSWYTSTSWQRTESSETMRQSLLPSQRWLRPIARISSLGILRVPVDTEPQRAAFDLLTTWLWPSHRRLVVGLTVCPAWQTSTLRTQKQPEPSVSGHEVHKVTSTAH